THRSEIGRPAAGHDRTGAGHPAAPAGLAAERRRAGRRRRCHAGQEPSVPQAGQEDSVMVPRLLPMLAVSAAPVDAPEYSFESKWDGIRALAAVEATGWRLWGRERADYTARYPELDGLRGLPAGTLLDGELVAFAPDGRPELPRLLRRHGLTDSWRI